MFFLDQWLCTEPNVLVYSRNLKWQIQDRIQRIPRAPLRSYLIRKGLVAAYHIHAAVRIPESFH